MPRIAEETIVAVKEATDIVSFISEYCRDLKASGKNYKARCPFHDEKTASFVVNQERQSFRCFGCGESGNAISFLMKIDNLSFPEAVRFLAKRSGIILKEVEAEVDSGLEKLYQINHWAKKWFEEALYSPLGEKTRKYLKSRGFEEKTIEDFSLGFAPPSWDALLRAGQQAGFSIEDLGRTGLLVVKDDGKAYDRFRDRLIFPIMDARNRVVGFGGRILEGEGVKYVNTPESPIFKKSQQLYGLHLASSELRKKRMVLLVEGYTDVMMAHQVGFPSAVAALGTALTLNHARLLKRWVDRVILTLDGDAAGRQAAWRALPIFLEKDLEVSFAPLPENADPYDLLRQGSYESFNEVIEAAVDPVDLAFDQLAAQASPDEVNRVVNSLIRTINVIPSPVRRELYLKKISDMSGLRVETLAQEVSVTQKPEKTARLKSFSSSEGFEEELTAEEEGILTAFVLAPEKIPFFADYLSAIDIHHPVIRRMLAKIISCYETNSQITANYVEASFQEADEMDLVARCKNQLVDNVEKLFLDCLKRLQQNQIQQYENLAKRARQQSDLETFQEYERKRYLLTRELKKNHSKKIVNNA